MKRVCLLTTSLSASHFVSLIQGGQKRNPAGQNFYQRLLSALCTVMEVEAISLSPETYPEEEGQHYVLHQHNKLRPFASAKAVVSCFEKLHEMQHFSYVLYDSLNLQLAKAAERISGQFHVPTVAICTDDPRNISHTNSTYQKLAMRLSSKASSYLCLTEGLNNLFNTHNAPHLIFPGIVSPITIYPRAFQEEYFYYGGSLYEKDGVGSLIRTFLASACAAHLLIAGHGEMEDWIKGQAAKNPRLLYLGQISQEKNAAYQQHACAVINPRWFRDDLDRVSVPSKDLEYLANAARVFATPSSSIQKDYSSSIFWLPKEPKALEECLKEIFDHYPTSLEKMPKNESQKVIQEALGYSAIGQAIDRFLFGC